jgi:hypothetical protein
MLGDFPAHHRHRFDAVADCRSNGRRSGLSFRRGRRVDCGAETALLTVRPERSSAANPAVEAPRRFDKRQNILFSSHDRSFPEPSIRGNIDAVFFGECCARAVMISFWRKSSSVISPFAIAFSD